MTLSIIITVVSAATAIIGAMILLGWRIAVAAWHISGALGELKAQIEAQGEQLRDLSKQIELNKADTDGQINLLRDDMSRQFNVLRDDMSRQFNVLRDDINTLRDDTNRQIDLVRTDIADFKTEIRREIDGLKKFGDNNGIGPSV